MVVYNQSVFFHTHIRIFVGQGFRLPTDRFTRAPNRPAAYHLPY